MRVSDINQKQNVYPADAVSSQKKEEAGAETENTFEHMPAAKVSISKEGMAAMEEAASKRTGCFGVFIGRDTTNYGPPETNEVYFENLMALGEVMTEVQKKYSPAGGRPDSFGVDSSMKTLAEGYEIMYQKILEQHKDGNREVTYEISGERSLSLEEDLAGLDEAYDYWLRFIDAQIFLQQKMKSWWPAGVVSANGEPVQRPDKSYLTEEYHAYRRSAIEIMQLGRQDFLASFKALNGEEGIMSGIINKLMNKTVGFRSKTAELWPQQYKSNPS